MSNALQVVTGSVLSTGQDLIAKSQAFKELGNLVQTGLFPKGIDSVQKVVAVCWMADAVGAHPMVALQNCFVVHGRVGFGWRFKWGLIKSRYPGAAYEVVEASATRHALRGRVSDRVAWAESEFTAEQCAKNPVTSLNDLYRTDWSDMGFKAAMNRLMDRIAPEVLMGLPSGELQEVGAEAEAPAPAKAGASVAEVLESAAGVGKAAAADNRGIGYSAGQGAPADPASPPAARDFTKECFAKIDAVWALKPKAAGAKRREVCEAVLSQIQGTKVVLDPKVGISPSDAYEVLRFLDEKYPNGAEENVGGPNGAPVGGSPAGAETSAPVSSGGEGSSGKDAPAAPLSMSDMAAGEGGGEYVVPLGEPDVDPVEAAAGAAKQERFDADGNVLTIFSIAKNAAKTHPGVPVVKKAPPESNDWYLVNMAVMQARGRTTGLLLQRDGEQRISADDCRSLVYLLREQGLQEAGGR